MQNKLEKLYIKKQLVDKKINQLENRITRKNSMVRNKLNNKKKRLAKIFLSSNYKSISKQTSFSMYEIYTIGGLIIMNGLDFYKSTVLLVAYNEIIKKCQNTIFKNIITRQGKSSYLINKKIDKDIDDKMFLINGILLGACEFILNSDAEELHKKGNLQFIQIRTQKIEKKHKYILDQLRD
jgi:hypothetical protein